MKFLWSLFKKGLSPILMLAGLYASSTESQADDALVALAKSVGEKLIPGVVKDGQWVGDPPVYDPNDKGKIVRAVSAVMLKELLLDKEFLRQANLSELQAGTVLIAALAKLKPDAVDTLEEREALLREAAAAVGA